MSGHLTWENIERSEGYVPPLRQESSETVDLPDLHWVWLLYNTHTQTPKHTHTRAATHNPVPLTPVFCVCVYLHAQTRRVRIPLVRSLGWLPCSSRLKFAQWRLAFPSIPCRDASPSQTLTMGETNLPHRGFSTSTVRLGQKNSGHRDHWDLSKVLKLHVCFATGGIDPWKELSVVRDRTEAGGAARTVFIEDTAHCADMMSKRVTDRKSLKRAQQVTHVQYVILHEHNSHFRS